MINNHFTASLSKMDKDIVRCIKPGGNWKQIPETIPSKRVETIRASYERGEGSRSTYYGRLRSDRPAYTINTYFSRPGNGCHIHYEEDRVLSQREAGRLQSFPDNFLFKGSQRDINTQIGNAVPPLLAYQVCLQLTKALGKTGQFVDLFAGAGGLGLGFKWAGWEPIVANDIVARYLETYAHNIHDSTIVGSIADPHVFEALVATAIRARKRNSDKPLWILGGPPCQGFSTAGKQRTMDDERNHLFMDYKDLVGELDPDGFVFENVSGLLNMEKGAVFERVKSAFRSVMPQLQGWVLQAEHFAIPQRRTRVFLVGHKDEDVKIARPDPLTILDGEKTLFDELRPSVTVEEAIGDLPTLEPKMDGSELPYKHEPNSQFQKLMRGEISPSKYLEAYKQ